MITQLNRLVDEVAALNSKLILLVGRPGCGKTGCLKALAEQRGLSVMKVGAELGRLLAATPQQQRAFQASTLMRDLADKYAGGDLLLLDNLEVLFEPGLQVDPLDLLRRLANARRVVAVWPGELRGDRLVYAEMSHPEHRDYSRDGVVVLEI